MALGNGNNNGLYALRRLDGVPDQDLPGEQLLGGRDLQYLHRRRGGRPEPEREEDSQKSVRSRRNSYRPLCSEWVEPGQPGSHSLC